MNKKGLKSKICVTLLFLLALLIIPGAIFAAGSYSASLASTIYVGKSASLTITSTNAAGKFNVTSSNPAVASVSAGTTWVDGRMDTPITVKGNAEGTAVITVAPVSVSDDEYNLLTYTKTFTVTVKKQATTPSTPSTPSKPTTKPTTGNTTGTTSKPTTETKKSSDATLATLSLKDFGIDFKKDITKYTVNVDKTVSKLDITAKATHSKASVKITGNENFKVGENIVKIIVTAEDGTTKTYQITVIKSKYGSGPLIDLKAKGYEFTEEFDPSILEYSLEVTGVNKLDIEYVLADKDSTVSIEGNENLKVGKNVIKVIVTEEDGTVTTYKINVNVLQSAEDVNENINNTWLIIIIILVIVIVGLVIYIVILKKKENK